MNLTKCRCNGVEKNGGGENACFGGGARELAPSTVANSVDGMGTKIEEPAGPAWHLEHGGKCGVTATARRAENSGLSEAGAGGGAGQGGIQLHFVTTCTCVEKNLDG